MDVSNITSVYADTIISRMLVRLYVYESGNSITIKGEHYPDYIFDFFINGKRRDKWTEFKLIPKFSYHSHIISTYF